MAPFASRITVTFERSLSDFDRDRTSWTGNPVRSELLQGDSCKAWSFFDLEPDVPCVLVIGGGTGARRLNEVIRQAIPDLIEDGQFIHLTGPHREGGTRSRRYRPYAFLREELAWAYAAADVVVSRGGLSTLSELAVLGKPTIVVPIRDSHQEENARWFEEHGAVICIREDQLTPDRLAETIRCLFESPTERQRLSNAISRMNPPDAADRLAQEIEKLAGCK
jgi:UDP-N-acetylglucosamine--N-acetylmuramyl-(pentapeptide) pyrophosphoryl-undecaprenol N-acetylglucosamine transferase